MAKVLKIPFGIRDDRLVHVSEVESGLQSDCLCPACASPLVARKGTLKVHHFAHSAETNCQPETVTHLLGKRLLAERIEKAIETGTPFPIGWKCSSCRDPHQTDLVTGACRVQLECDLGPLQPDVVLFGSDDAVVAVVEVVVTHPPEDNVLSFCAEKRIPIFEYRIKTFRDLERMREADRLDPTKSTLCTRPKCEKCGSYLVQRTLYVVPGECWKCKAGMQIAFVSCEGMMLSPEEMTPPEIEEATKSGAHLQQNASATRGQTYLSNTCGQCGALTGSFYLHDFWDLAYDTEGLDTGLACMDCVMDAGGTDE